MTVRRLLFNLWPLSQKNGGLMALTTKQTAETIKKFRRNELDTGSSEVQIALLTGKINALSQHFQAHKKDVHGRRGLVTAVNLRRKLLDYLRFTDGAKYEKLIKELEIRK
jgi:small subunit ribosomal protein S15